MNRSETQQGYTVNPPSHTILLVDDEPGNLAALTNYLAERGFRILAAQTGEAGLDIAHNVLPGLILLDVLLPGIDGLEVCRRLKADARTRAIPVIFMTIVTGNRGRDLCPRQRRGL
jgi:CheY-like chemotaxis protein